MTETLKKRRVRWRRSQVQALGLCAVICLISVAAILLQAVQQGRESIRLEGVTRPTTAVVTRRWKTRAGVQETYWISYRYPQLSSSSPDVTQEVSHLWWAEMPPGSQMVIQYHPAAPESNGLKGGAPPLFKRWLWTGGATSAFCIAAVLFLFGLSWSRKRDAFHLVRTGRSAVGEITDISETMRVRGNRRDWHYDISYCYPLPDGSMAHGHRTENRSEPRSWEIGDPITIFYDPRNPSHHAAYGDLPAEVISAG